MHAAVELARTLGAELEIIEVVDSTSYGTPALMSGGPSVATLREDIERRIQESLDAVVAGVGTRIPVKAVRLTGWPADMLAEYSSHLDLLVTGSRGYGPLRSVLVGGVSGRLVRTAHCPVIVVPRGIEAPLAGLFGDVAATVA